MSENWVDGFQEGEEDVKQRKTKKKKQTKNGSEKRMSNCVGERQLIQSHREQKK